MILMMKIQNKNERKKKCLFNAFKKDEIKNNKKKKM